jgi:hypothetical protein
VDHSGTEALHSADGHTKSQDADGGATLKQQVTQQGTTLADVRASVTACSELPEHVKAAMLALLAMKA